MSTSTPPSSQQRSILDEWEAEAYSPESLGSPDRAQGRIPQVHITVDGANLKRFQFTNDNKDRFFDGCDPYRKPAPTSFPLTIDKGSDIITRLCQRTELAIELGKHLPPRDIVTLYSISRAFHAAINGYMMASIRIWVAYKAPLAGSIFEFKLYRRHLVPDPAGRTWEYQYNAVGDSGEGEAYISAEKASQVRTIPGLKYLQLITGRDRYCREILAILARNGHRTPATMHATLLKLWLLLDIPTSLQRAALLRNDALWTDCDLYNAQMLFVKLAMHFNDPVYGPNTYELLHLMFGQKGLFPLWQLLLRKRFTHLSELLALKVRYDMQMPRGHWGHEFFDTSIHGVPYTEIGKGHLERVGGEARHHLMRPDELIPIEAVARGLELDKHIIHMMIWGYVDTKTGENLVPSEEEMYISDGERVLAHADTSHHWRRKHVLKKRFEQLSLTEQQAIIDDDEDERLRAMAWCGDAIDDYSSAESNDEDDDDDAYSLNDEIRRGYIVRPRGRDVESQTVTVPDTQDRKGWADFVNQALMGLPPSLGEDEKLRAEAWQSYQTVETEGEWDWAAWMAQEERRWLAGVEEGDMWSETDGEESEGGEGFDEEDEQ